MDMVDLYGIFIITRGLIISVKCILIEQFIYYDDNIRNFMFPSFIDDRFFWYLKNISQSRLLDFFLLIMFALLYLNVWHRVHVLSAYVSMEAIIERK